MEKEFVPYELSVKLKELGFDEPCIMCYRNGILYGSNIAHGYQDNWFFKSNSEHNNNIINKENPFYWISSPLWQQVFNWFREKYGYLPIISNYSSNATPNFGYSAEDYLKDDEDLNKHSILSTIGFKTYEEARQACLEKLIEIAQGD